MHPPALGLAALLGSLSIAAGCASASKAPSLVRPRGPLASTVADVQLAPGTDTFVRLSDGRTVRGRLVAVTDDRLEIADADGLGTGYSFDHERIVLVARMAGMPKGRRGCIGAALGALVSIPLGISMPGDMVIPAAIVGALVGRSTGDARAEVVFERSIVP
jgi:hypothetical protein